MVNQTQQSPMPCKGAGQELGGSGDTCCSEEGDIMLSRWDTASGRHTWLPWD